MGVFAIIVLFFVLKFIFKTDNNRNYTSTYNSNNTSVNNTPKTTHVTKSSSSNLDSNKLQNNRVFTPDFTQFIGGINTGQYTYYYIYDYLPKSRFAQGSITEKQLTSRYLIYNFKDGINSEYFAKLFASACYNKFGKEFMKKQTILIIPASSKLKTISRFKSFLLKFCEFTGSNNGFELLNNSDIEKTPTTQGGSTLSQSNLKFNGDLSYRNFIIIDDVRTQGRSSQLIYSELKRRNAGNIIFCYLGRTVPIDFSNNSNKSVEDLPF